MPALGTADVEIHTEPLDADGRSGVVLIALPDGGHLALSVQAAEQTSLRLLEAATFAQMPARYRCQTIRGPMATSLAGASVCRGKACGAGQSGHTEGSDVAKTPDANSRDRKRTACGF